MCGIIGIVGSDQPVALDILGGLKRLEYRGYDSAGIATLANGHIDRRRAEGKLIRLSDRLAEDPLPGHIGIGHTRWATHGVPNEANAHPHATDRVALVHNGIIENFRELKAELNGHGVNFASETDTEVVAHLLSQLLRDGATPIEAAADTLKRLEGAFALAIIFAGEHNLMIGARQGSPLVLGYGDGAMYLGSDAIALAPWTDRICYLDEGDWVVLRHDQAEVRDVDDQPVEREVKKTAASLADISKGNHRHFMMKEIFEQPTVIGDTLHAYFNPVARAIEMPNLQLDFADLDRLTILACGTAFYAAMVAKYWFEAIARLPVDVDIASEFRYRETPIDPDGTALFISQSGETLDTLSALKLCKDAGQRIVSLVNVAESAVARESDEVLLTHAGPEICVAATKTFTTQLSTLACMVLTAARQRGTLGEAEAVVLSAAIAELPSRMADILNHDEQIRELAQDMFQARDVLYLGRGTAYPIALEGALKLKEISYIHAEGYPAGELKHGPIALVTDDVPVVVLAPADKMLDKTASNVAEVAARGGRVVLITDAEGAAKCGAAAWRTIELPSAHAFVAPILYTVPVQLLAYHIAVLKGTDVDQPRNLAKSVTVE